MWCILRCHSGYENEVIQSCRQSLARQGFSDVFIFTYDRMKRYQGAWHMVKDVMFPGCVFLESGTEGSSDSFLRDSQIAAGGMEMHEIFYSEMESTHPEIEFVHPEIETLLRKMCGSDHHLSMSEGYIRNGVTYVTTGPLVGMERFIRRIDRHKRTARVVIPTGMMARHVSDREAIRSMTAGLEIVSKS